MFRTLLDPGTTGGVGVAVTDRYGGVPESAGSLDLGRGRDAHVRGSAAAENVRLVREALGLRTLVTVDQVHGADVLVIDEARLASWRSPDDGPELAPQSPLSSADALVTTMPRVGLCVRVADCMPILLADPSAGVVGAAHAGRVGLAAGVIEATLDAMRGLGATQVTAWIGPSVCGRCYEVPAAMRAEVAGRLPETWAVSATGTPSLDLSAGAAAILSRAGCRVHALGGCTVESADLHSHRRDGQAAGRFAGICWLA